MKRNSDRLAPVVPIVVAAFCWVLGSPALGVDLPKIRLEPCGPPEARQDVLCGSVSVLENPQRPAGRRIGIRVEVLPALEGLRSGGAMFHLEGGPGIPATGARDFYLGPGRDYRRGRDVVLLDQRGVGSDGLHCPALENRGPLDDDYTPAAVTECRLALERRADLTQYGTWNSAGDIDLVRAALGYESIDVWALSYGTKLAQVYIKRFPKRVRTAFFLGTAPIDFQPPLFHAVNAQRALDEVFFDCQSDRACRSAYPDLRGDWQRLLTRLDSAPVRVAIPGAGKGEEKTAEIRRGAFAEALRNLMSTTAQQRRLPLLIHSAALGDFAPFLGALRAGPSQFTEGLYLSVTCAEGAARIAAADVGPVTTGTFLGSYRVTGELSACGQWPRRTVADDFFAPATADVPVLIVSGDADAVTPPSWAARVCASLPRCRLIRVPHLAHGPFDLDAWTGGDCLDRLAMDLYHSGSAEAVDANCVTKMVPPPFAVAP